MHIPVKPPNIILIKINKYILYNPRTGIAVWKKSPSHQIKIGDKVGNARNDGYIRVNFYYFGKHITIYMHHIVWYIQTGEWPPYQIDHRDGNPSNNRWRNLRIDKYYQNNQNKTKLMSTNKTGVHGVFKNKHGSYITQIMIHGKRTHLGSFHSLAEAKEVRRNAELKYYGKFASPL